MRRRAIFESEGAAEFLPPTPSFRRTRADFGKRLRNCVSNFGENDFEPYCKDTLGHSIATIVFSSLEENDWQVKDLSLKILDNRSPDTAIIGFHFKEDRTVSIPQKTLYFDGTNLIEQD